ncbi:hypothetical protein [Thauera sp. SDU_THAU2]|uniref:hypothetical protein n=1 Tax=Thauera sp. SDU_THAU2 TaxID=3136633 RepID=UPI00311F4858
MQRTASGTHAHAHSAPTLSPSFTPGPWRAIGHRQIVGSTPAGLPVCEVWPGGVGAQQADANERLIAAAPDLYQALCAALVGLVGCNDDGMFDAEEHAIRAVLCKVAGDPAAFEPFIQPAPTVDADFPAVLTADDVRSSESGYEASWGDRRRLMMLSLTRSSEQLRVGGGGPDVRALLLEMAGEIAAYRDHLKSGLDVAELAIQRLEAVALSIVQGGEA